MHGANTVYQSMRLRIVQPKDVRSLTKGRRICFNEPILENRSNFRLVEAVELATKFKTTLSQGGPPVSKIEEFLSTK